MYRALVILLVTSLTLSACGISSPSIWGTAMTPTPSFFQPSGFQTDPQPASVDSTPSPTSTFSPLNDPPDLPLETPTPPNNSQGEPTYTATFDTVPILYYAQSGDSIPSLMKRFNVDRGDISSSVTLPESGLIDPGTLLVIPDRISEPTTPNIQIMPDNEIIFSATAVDFDTRAFIREAGGRLGNFREYLGSTGWIDGDEAIVRLAYENSINPRILLGVLEYESRWVRGEPVDPLHTDYPMGYDDFRFKGMYIQMVWALNQMFAGYYGWRAGTLTHLDFPDGTRLRIDPRLNAGTVAIQYLFSRLYSQSQWAQVINPENGFPAMYTGLFGDPWARADLVNPILPPGLTQPKMVLPFEPNVEWNMVQGPHGAWQHIGPLAAIDLAPSTDHGGCDPTPTWVLAAAPGLVVRTGNGVVVVDMDGDGYEETGWNILYLHIGTEDRVKKGTWLETDDRIGHASCEGGESYGTHIHFARKYNGEWIAADGPVPMVLGGWTVFGETVPHEGFMKGSMIKGDLTVIADEVGQKWSNITREPNE